MYCSNCKTNFKPNKKTLICLTCFKCYCEKPECWIDCNDEYFQWETDGSIRGNKGEIYIFDCDYCNHNLNCK
jgi:hypothetical protein